MSRKTRLVMLTLAVLLAVPLAALAGDPVNTKCPISGQPADGSVVVEAQGESVALCCGGCRRQFLAWDDTRQKAFIAAAGGTTLSEPPATKAAATSRPAATAAGDPYPLAVCPISGGALGSMGDPVVRTYDGREVRFCCGGCVAPFEKDLKASWKKVDEAIVKSQLAFYPLTTCVVMPEEALESDMGDPVDFVYSNRLVRFCCKRCRREFKKDPAQYLLILDAAVIKEQTVDYPLDTCVVSGGKLGSMGDPVDVVIGNRLVRLCCAGCTDGLRENAPKHLATLDAAWKKAGRKMTE